VLEHFATALAVPSDVPEMAMIGKIFAPSLESFDAAAANVFPSRATIATCAFARKFFGHRVADAFARATDERDTVLKVRDPFYFFCSRM